MNGNLRRGNGYIGGVCEGLGKWTGIPSILWRLIFLLANFPSILVYVILWIFVKKNETDQ